MAAKTPNEIRLEYYTMVKLGKSSMFSVSEVKETASQIVTRAETQNSAKS